MSVIDEHLEARLPTEDELHALWKAAADVRTQLTRVKFKAYVGSELHTAVRQADDSLTLIARYLSDPPHSFAGGTMRVHHMSAASVWRIKEMLLERARRIKDTIGD